MIQVLFVCLGNICRSPMAEAVFRDLVVKNNLQDKIRVDSSGTGNWHTGEPPHSGTREVLDREKISYKGIKARQVSKNDWDDFDYIIAMDDQNIKDLRKLNPQESNIVIAKLMDFVEEAKENNVPDPYYTGDFDYTYELVLEGCSNLLSHIKQKHSM
ncbi:low molecular weight protein-tyrosine-phosphatase [Ornithinibacillus scapharcae]|uniref:low molecular weight protein-tyrosine-phosphatase n=1 Tax=Ornithinibacillus scapharcae TaxID=1147159 RepID=UPI000225BA79|nr:low molecular weight protein-tyrosine-phosphatase [Ornithinibacillus scapharcae]